MAITGNMQIIKKGFHRKSNRSDMMMGVETPIPPGNDERRRPRRGTPAAVLSDRKICEGEICVFPDALCGHTCLLPPQ